MEFAHSVKNPGVIVSYEAIRFWCLKFGPKYARTLRKNVSILLGTGAGHVSWSELTVAQNIYIKVFDPELRDATEGFSIEPGQERHKK